MKRISENLERVKRRIEEAAAAAGRPGDGVKLVAVSKGHPADAIRRAYAVGQRRFGENYAQEFAAKAEALSDCPDIEWHFIGHVQSNKAKIVAPHAQVVQTVDSPALARELARRVVRAGRAILPVLVEVNVAREPQKHGVWASDLRELIDAIGLEPSLELRGLMTVPPTGDLGASRAAFETLESLRSLHGGPSRLPDLSMGMSHDLEVAVAAGATIVRVGEAIFGPREQSLRGEERNGTGRREDGKI
jgi:pyridoxal phosphate enzyme (YggS family)